MLSFKKSILLFLLLTLVFLLIFIHFFWQPDGLAKFIPKQSLFYLHFDLSFFRRVGQMGNDWLKNKEVHAFWQRLLAGNENLSLVESILKEREYLDELGVIGLKKQGQENEKIKFDLVFFLKTKRWTEPPLLNEQLHDFEVKKLTNRIWAVSLRDVLKKDVVLKNFSNFSRDKLSFSKNFLPFWLKGYFYSQGIGLSPVDDFYEPVRIKCFSFQGLSDLFFNLETVKQESAFNFPFSLTGEEKFKQGYILVFLKQETKEEFENKIKTKMALEKPTEKTVLLPDGTSFIEQEANPEVYKFVDEEIGDLKIRQLALDQKGVSKIFLYQDQNYFYLSSQSHLFKAVNGLLGALNPEGLIKGIYLFVNDRGIRDLTIIETSETVKGVLRVF